MIFKVTVKKRTNKNYRWSDKWIVRCNACDLNDKAVVEYDHVGCFASFNIHANALRTAIKHAEGHVNHAVPFGRYYD